MDKTLHEAPSRNRTYDLYLIRVTLYRLSYGSMFDIKYNFILVFLHVQYFGISPYLETHGDKMAKKGAYPDDIDFK